MYKTGLILMMALIMPLCINIMSHDKSIVITCILQKRLNDSLKTCHIHYRFAMETKMHNVQKTPWPLESMKGQIAI